MSDVTAAPAEIDEDRRLAVLHLRLGNLSLARAELEDLGRRGLLDASASADLADVRWRTGDLDGAAVAAITHLEAGGTRRIALVIAAEAAAAAGRPVEARAHVEALGAVDAETLDRLFAGMPRRAFWPSAPTSPSGPPDTLFGAERAGAAGMAGDEGMTVRRRQLGRGPGGLERRLDGPRDRRAELRGGGAMDEGRGRAAEGADSTDAAGSFDTGLWADQLADAATVAEDRRNRGGLADPAAELGLAREEIESGNAGSAQRGLSRLAIVLRLDPSFAPDVLAALGPRRDAASLTIRGDCLRLLGRQLEAEAAFAAASDALDGPEPGRTP